MMITTALTYLSWPLSMFAAVIATYSLWNAGVSLYLSFVLVYIMLALFILTLEQVIPRKLNWRGADPETSSNILFTLLSLAISRNFMPMILTISIIWLLGQAADASQQNLWPDHWPLLGQIFAALMMIEFVTYWGHRISHQSRVIWKYHMIHHSVKRLWLLNTGRFHPGDVLLFVLPVPLIILFDIPRDVIIWQAALTAFVGLWGHSNTHIRLGFLCFIFNNPILHRWHHSQRKCECDHNYGQTFCFYDMLFKTYYNPHGELPHSLGISYPFPDNFLQQLLLPWKQHKKTRNISSKVSQT